MPRRLNSADAGFEADFRELLAAKREVSVDVNDTVAAILAEVRARGDEAVIEYTERFDRVKLTPETMDRICAMVRTGAPYRTACVAAGVSERAFLNWRNRAQEPDGSAH